MQKDVNVDESVRALANAAWRLIEKAHEFADDDALRIGIKTLAEAGRWLTERGLDDGLTDHSVISL